MWISWMSTRRVTRINKGCHTNEWVTPRTYMSCHTYKCPVTHIKVLSHIYKRSVVRVTSTIHMYSHTFLDWNSLVYLETLKIGNEKFWTQKILGKPSRRLRTPKEKRKNKIWLRLLGPRKWMSHATPIMLSFIRVWKLETRHSGKRVCQYMYMSVHGYSP